MNADMLNRGRRYDVNKNISILMLFDCVRVQNTGLGIH
jgi:hypothetical protein